VRTSRLLAACCALVLASGCAASSDDETVSETPTPSATATAAPIDRDQIACKLVTSAERTKLVGAAIDDVVEAAGADGSSRCRWQSATALVQVTTLPAAEWATSLPDVVQQLESSSDISSSADRKDLAEAKKLLAGAASFTDEQACDAFTTLAELGGAADGATTTVTTLPITETESGISGQTCTDGHLTSVIYSVPGLKQTDAVDQALTAILASAQRRLDRA
jgi:hypothetical protein